MQGKLIVLSAPSGSGKTTIMKYLLEAGLNLEFSISATTRQPRGTEQDGVAYYFLSVEDFKRRIVQGDFLEYEEVYKDCFYGTLKTEIERITSQGRNVVFDVDVLGGLNIKKQYPEQTLTLFIQPPSVEELQKRLLHRATDCAEMIQKRVEKAAYEMTFAPQFDAIIVNDDLERARKKAETVIREFLSKKA